MARQAGGTCAFAVVVVGPERRQQGPEAEGPLRAEGTPKAAFLGIQWARGSHGAKRRGGPAAHRPAPSPLGEKENVM